MRDRGLEDRFLLAGERRDVAELLPAFDVFAMSSRYEGLPCAVVEAMRCGVPVVVTAVNSVPDLVVPGETGVLVPPGRPLALAAALGGVLDEPDRAAAMVARGRERASDAFDEERLGQALDEEYSRALRSGTDRHGRVSPEASFLTTALTSLTTLTERTRAVPLRALGAADPVEGPRPWSVLCPEGTVIVRVERARATLPHAGPRHPGGSRGQPALVPRPPCAGCAGATGCASTASWWPSPRPTARWCSSTTKVPTVARFWGDVAAIPPAPGWVTAPASLVLAVAARVPWQWTGALAPGRVVLGERR